MTELVGYELQIQRGRGWETVERFGAAEQPHAKSAFDGFRVGGEIAAVRWIEETVGADGLFKTRTLGFRKGRPAEPQPKPSRPSRRSGKSAAGSGGGAATGSGGRSGGSATRPGGRTDDGVRTATTDTRSAPGRRPTPAQQMKASGSRFSFTDLLSYLFSPSRDAADAAPVLQQAAAQGAAAKLPAPPRPVAKRGDIDVFEDEAGLASAELVAADSTVRQFHSFVEALNALDTAGQARANPKFVHGISLFTIGALFSIEEQIDIFSKRGKAVVHACLELFVELHATIAHFIGSLERYLQDPDAPGWIRSGSRCFRMYRDADFRGLEREFGESFGVYDKIEETLGGRVKVGIMFTDIVNSTAMTGALGDDLAQRIIDHHDETVEGLARRFGGRKVKHLGDGLMLCFGSAQAMASCAVAVVDAMKGLTQQAELPVYQIRCGGHFGEAIHKADDFFGSTVQLAARVSGAAENNEARFCSMLIDGKAPIFTRFEDCGAASLKGFEQPVMLARYR